MIGAFYRYIFMYAYRRLDAVDALLPVYLCDSLGESVC